jgi:hypothetical protein
LSTSPASAATSASASSPSSASSNVLAGALSQYNANGQLIANVTPATQVAATSTTGATNQLIGQSATTQTTVSKNGGSTS